MGPVFSAYVLAMLVGVAFIPLFVLALAVLHSATRAFVLAATFTGGGMLGFFFGLLAGSWLLDVHSQDNTSLVLLFTFASAAAVAGGAIAVWLLAKVTKDPPWRRN